MRIMLWGLFLATLILTLGPAEAEKAAKSAPVLAQADLTGFHLHTSWSGSEEISPDVETYWTFKSARKFLESYELWMTITEAEWDKAINPRKVSRQSVSLKRWAWQTPQQARAFVEIVYPVSKARNPRAPYPWVAGSPSGNVVGDVSWYKVYPTPGNREEELSNQHALTIVAVVGKTVITLEAQASRDRPLDKVWVEGLARKVASRV